MYTSQKRNEKEIVVGKLMEQKVENKKLFNILLIKRENNLSTIFEALVPFLVYLQEVGHKHTHTRIKIRSRTHLIVVFMSSIILSFM